MEYDAQIPDTHDVHGQYLNPRAIDPSAVSAADQDHYKSLSSSAAKGVAVLTAKHRNWDYAAVVTDYLSISYDPPTMLASLYSLSRMVDAVEGSGRWGLSLLTDRQIGIADRLSEPGAPLVGLLDNVPHFRREESGPPYISDALSWFELRTLAAHPAATHTLFIGEVTWMAQALDNGAGPLVRYRSEYHGL
jgi:flavin reductase (DIM6/NTAB) family NADH-FMN oxidoreductase RutF